MTDTDIRTFGVPKGEGRYPEQIIYSLAVLYNVVSTDIAQFLRRYNLSLGKFNILMAIRRHSGPSGIRQVDISQHLIVTASNMTKMLDKLQDEGLVKRHILRRDRRVRMVQITDTGNGLINRLWDQYQALLQHKVNSLQTQKQQQLAALLTEWFEGK